MKVILLEDIAKLGRKYEQVDVARGYGYNYLLPNQKAIEATEANLARLTKQREEAQKRLEAEIEKATETIANLSQATITLKRIANEKGGLYESISVYDIKKAMEHQMEMIVPDDAIFIDDAIKEVGEHTVRLELGDAETTLKVMIEADEDSSERIEKSDSDKEASQEPTPEEDGGEQES